MRLAFLKHEYMPGMKEIKNATCKTYFHRILEFATNYLLFLFCPGKYIQDEVQDHLMEAFHNSIIIYGEVEIYFSHMGK